MRAGDVSEIVTALGPAEVQLDRPPRARALTLLTHGSAGGVDTADLLAVRDALVGAGVAVARVMQPYRLAGRRAPGAPPRQDAAWLEIVTALRARRGMRALPLVLGGRSNGARVACRTAPAAGAVGVLALAFPLHPPGRPEVTRVDELAAAGVPVLVVQGDRDPFGMPVPAPGREVVVIPRADHSLSRDPAAVAVAALAAVESWI